MNRFFEKVLVTVIFCSLWFFSCFSTYGGGFEISNKIDPANLVKGRSIRLSNPFKTTEYSAVSFQTRVYLVYGKELMKDIPGTESNLRPRVDYALHFYDDRQVFQDSIRDSIKIQLPLEVKAVNNHIKNYGSVRLFIRGVYYTSGLPADVRLELSLAGTDVNDFAAGGPAFSYDNSTKKAWWQYLRGAEKYQLEWVYIDSADTKYDSIASAPVKAFTYKEPVRITTSEQSYLLDYNYPAGRLYMRVRGAGSFAGQTATTIQYSSWSDIAVQATSSFEKRKTWQYVTTYTEDGAYKKVMKYMDGSLRSRQQATNLSSENLTLVGETKYDYEGRPAINVLPVPVPGSSLAYRTSLNVIGSGAKSAYDNATGGGEMATTAGASNYYSPSNTSTALLNKHIPDAEKYPYSQTEYTLDNSGRVSRQSVPGKTLALADTGRHYTSNFYGSASTTELQRLFGSNVGSASHYKKTMTLDANKQASVTYQDQEGRTIATALTGSSPAALETLPNNSGPVSIPVNLNSVIDYNNFTSTSVNTILNAAPTDYVFSYDATGVIYKPQLATVCTKCKYKVNFTIVDPDGTKTYDSSATIASTGVVSTCNAPGNMYNFSIRLAKQTFSKVGAYTVTKKLTLDSGSVDIFIQSIRQTAFTPADSVTYINSKLSQIDTSSCDLTCEQRCTTKVKRMYGLSPGDAGFTTRFNEIVATDCTPLIQAAIDSTSKNECASYRVQMMDQVSPGGIYSTVAWMNTNKTGITFRDSEGGPVSSPQPSAADLIDADKFKWYWAEQLLPKHPEYCVYDKQCAGADNNKYAAGATYDKKLALIKDWTAAGNKIYTGTLKAEDAFLARLDQLGLHVSDTINIYFREASKGIDINNNGNTTDTLSLRSYVACAKIYGGTAPSAEQKWQLFRSLYSGLKLQVWGKYVKANCAGGYLANDNAVIKDPVQPQTQTGIDNAMSAAWVNNCNNTCAANTDVWLSWIANNCDTAGLGSAGLKNISNRLKNYCVRSCGYDNPLGQLLSSAPISTDPDLSVVQGILSGRGCSLANMAIADNRACVMTMENGRSVTPLTYKILSTINLMLNSYNSNQPDLNTCPPSGQNMPLYKTYKRTYGGKDRWAMFTDIDPMDNDTSDHTKTVLIIGDMVDPNFFFFVREAGSYDNANIGKSCSCLVDLEVCVPNTGPNVQFMLIENGIATPVPTADLIQVTNPRVDYGYNFDGNTWDNGTAWGIAIDITYRKNGLITTKKGYFYYYLGYGYKSPKQTVCLAKGFSSCEPEPNPAPTCPETLATASVSMPVADSSFTRVNILISGKPALAAPVTYIGQSATLASLASQLNALPKSDYTYTVVGTTLKATGKAGTGNRINNSSLLLAGYKTTGDSYTGLSEGIITGGRNVNECGCKDEYTPLKVQPEDLRKQCIEDQKQNVIYQANTEWKQQVAEFVSSRLSAHYNACMNTPFTDEFWYQANSYEYQYTLYYYDQAGSLVQTVPPAGVVPVVPASMPKGKLNPGAEPVHTLLTKYKYNSIGQLTWQKSPDGGETYFWYDDKGQLRLSQNAKQLAASSGNSNKYSYTKYDGQGRVTESGQAEGIGMSLSYMLNTSNKKAVRDSLNLASFPNKSTGGYTDRVTTYYDQPASYATRNLRGRVAATFRNPGLFNREASTYYNYDAHGNVYNLRQVLPYVGVKEINYQYDLISGKVTSVTFAPGSADQFIHRYRYDADNRLTSVRTSADGIIWQEDARYFYYRHGPLARVELGNDKVQGLDYSYTLQGWLKAVNSPNILGTGGVVTLDPGYDGLFWSSQNPFSGQDAFAYALGYYKNDYKAIGFSMATEALGAIGASTWYNGETLKDGLYNGNITSMAQVVYPLASKLGIANQHFGVRGNAYRYDQLNRLTKAYSMSYGTPNVSWDSRTSAINTAAYDAAYGYDPNGNINYGALSGATASLADSLGYKYYTGNNRLRRVTDGGDTVNVKPGQAVTNYTYDAIGNLTGDAQAQTTIIWTASGKVSQVTTTKAGQPNLTFIYDAQGNRVLKISKLGSNPEQYTAYMRDAQGNVLGTYQTAAGSLGTYTVETPVYGSSRLGVYRRSSGVYFASKSIFAVTKKDYELSNHLGNVLATISDRRLGVDNNADGIVDLYKADLTSANDYYPFGGAIAARSWVSQAYRYGFNGKEKDAEGMGGGGSTYDYGARIYNPAIGRWLSVDPLADKQPGITSYRFGFNNPIVYKDDDGRYETDGHYWTTYLVATLLQISGAQEIAYYSEYPDHVMNNSGQAVKETNTWMNPSHQYFMHALTGGDASAAREKGFDGVSSATNNKTRGLRAHYLMDSYAHTDEKGGQGKQFSPPLGHLFKMHEPDEIANYPEKYLGAVQQLSFALSKSVGQPATAVDMFTFNYIADNKFTTDQNSDILKTEVMIRQGSTSFDINPANISIVNQYLQTRNKSYTPVNGGANTSLDKEGNAGAKVTLTY